MLPGDCHGPMGLAMTDFLHFCMGRYGSVVVMSRAIHELPLQQKKEGTQPSFIPICDRSGDTVPVKNPLFWAIGRNVCSAYSEQDKY